MAWTSHVTTIPFAWVYFSIHEILIIQLMPSQKKSNITILWYSEPIFNTHKKNMELMLLIRQTFLTRSRFSSQFEHKTIELKFSIFLACSCTIFSHSAWAFLSSSNSKAMRSLSSSVYRESVASSRMCCIIHNRVIHQVTFQTCNNVFRRFRISSSKCSEWEPWKTDKS